MARTITIGNAQGFWGDSADAPARLVAQRPDLDYLTLDYLAEVSMSIMALQRDRDPEAGYARDFIGVVRGLAPHWKAGGQTRVVCNAGGLNPEACAAACRAALAEAGLPDLPVGVVTGDDVLAALRDAPDAAHFKHLETGAPLTGVLDALYTANAYIGADAVAQALDQGARIVVTGRVADPSLAVGIARHAFGWDTGDHDLLAAATIAGHVLECGAQACGGISTHWLEMPDPANMGFPIAELSEDGGIVITKPEGTGGRVTEETVKEQLLYEIGDPQNYLSPDCRVDFTAISVAQDGADRVRISGAQGGPPPETYKVSATCRDGYTASGMLTIFGRDAVVKARRSGEIILERLRAAGHTYERHLIECLGANACVQGVLAEPDLRETVLRISVADPSKEAVARFAREIAPVVTSGPQGATGYAAGRPSPRQVFSYWPCLIPRDQVQASVTVA